MAQVNIHEAKTNLSQLIKRALMGESIIITKANKPLVELVVLPEEKRERRLGGADGRDELHTDRRQAVIREQAPAPLIVQFRAMLTARSQIVYYDA